ncbi:putative fels-2 prophage Pin [Escherichia coli 2-156-04_S4_C3]|nr:putative fels-2 prophage Pin [Escherichia coli 2-156-04_S4_C3]
MGEITLMAGTNDFKAFATDANANVTSQEEWETLTALKKGFSSGKASSAQVSKALRQPSTMAAVLGQFIANAELDALDDGDVDGLVAKLATAITTNLGLGEIATVADIQAGTASKLVDAEGLKKYLPTKVMQVSGFIRIPDVPGGTIIQWGQVTETINEGTKNVVLPTPFPNSGRFAIAIPLNLAGDTSCDIFAQLQSASLTGINFFFSWVSSSTPANGFQWFAIGY